MTADEKRRKAISKTTYERGKRNYDRMQLMFPKGAGASLKKLAAESGKSLTRYIAEIIERETGVKCTLDGEFPQKKYFDDPTDEGT